MTPVQAMLALWLLAVPANVAAQPVTLHAGARITLATTETLSSKTTAKGDMVSLRTSDNLTVDGRVVIPAGTLAVGQVSDARDTGGLGVSGKLVIRPLYLRVGDKTVRLKGGATEKAEVDSGVVIGVALVGVASGHRATIPAGTILAGEVEKDVTIEPIAQPAH
jgi:hypothetical protein